MIDEPLELSGRFVRVPVEFVERKLHPWMEPAAWRDSYIRMQRHRTFKAHKRRLGLRDYKLNEGELLVSVSWLVETCPDLTEKSARLFLQRLEEEGLLVYPRGKKRGARVQHVGLIEAWTPTQVSLKHERRKAKEAREALRANSQGDEGRTRQPRKLRHSNRKRKRDPDEGRTQNDDGGELAPPGANSTPSRANSGTEIEGPEGGQGEVEGELANAQDATTARGFGWQQPGRGELKGELAGRGGIGGEGEEGSVRSKPPLSPPRKKLEKSLSNELLAFAKGYCAPDRDGVLPMKGRELTDLRVLVEDVYDAAGTSEAVREFFVRARRWADSKAIERMNATFVRTNQAAIKDYTALTLQEERARAAKLRKRDEDDRSYEAQAEAAKWQARAALAFEALDTEDQQRRLDEADELVPDVGDDPLARRVRAMAVKAAALARLGSERGDPQPEGG